jgi:hypothetical protein
VSLAWFGAHVVALVILTLITPAYGVWFWTVGSLTAVGGRAGQLVPKQPGKMGLAATALSVGS